LSASPRASDYCVCVGKGRDGEKESRKEGEEGEEAGGSE